MSSTSNHKLAGILVPVFALRTKLDLGIGDTNAMLETIDYCADESIGVLQVLPVNETGGDNSPYNAVSSMALDPVYISITPNNIPYLTEQCFRKIAPDTLIASLKKGPVNYPTVKKLKEELLFAAFHELTKTDPHGKTPDSKQLHNFKMANATWLPAYTLFRTIMKEQGNNANWLSWPLELQDYNGAERWLESSADCQRLTNYREFLSFVQWIAHQQWSAVKLHATKNKVMLLGDVPFGISRFSADVWAQPNLFDLTWFGGAPPETFFQTDLFVQQFGQNWGIPLYDWEEHAKEHFAWWKQRIHGIGCYFHGFRIDHVLGFFRIYAFPWAPEKNSEFLNLTAEAISEKTDGRLPQFLPFPDDQLALSLKNADQGKAILKVLKHAANGMAIVAEDLGMVPAYVRPILKELEIPGFYIPIFERTKDLEFKSAATIPTLSLATYGTHDHLPLACYYQQLVDRWQGPDGHEGWLEMKRLMRFLHLDENNPPTTFTPALHKAFLKTLLESPSWLVVFMITDLLLTKQRFNEPGASFDSNWSLRLDKQLASYKSDPEFTDRLATFANLTKQCGRSPMPISTSEQ